MLHECDCKKCRSRRYYCYSWAWTLSGFAFYLWAVFVSEPLVPFCFGIAACIVGVVNGFKAGFKAWKM